MRGDRICPKCGQTIPRGTAECPICARPISFYLRRETLLLVCFAVLAILFTITGFAVKLYHGREQSLARSWYNRGENSLQKRDAAGAIEDFRNALFHEPGEPLYQLRLAQALTNSDHFLEARSYLLRLWAGDPANGPVNLALARLTISQGGPPSQVITYFQSAIDGVWNGQTEDRFAIREELCEYLIDHGERTEAAVELAALAPETPNNAKLITQVGTLFSQAQDYALALKEFQQSLHLNAHQPDAWAGAGQAAFALGQYRAATHELSRAVAERSQDPDAVRVLGLARDILEINPFDRHIPVQDRRRRAFRAFQTAMVRLNQCAQSKGETLGVQDPQSKLQTVYADALKMKPQVQSKAFQRNPDLLDSEMGLVFRIEEVTKDECGAPSGLDEALVLISSKNGAPD